MVDSTKAVLPNSKTGPSAASSEPQKSWLESFRIYLHLPVLIMLVLGFSAGLPFLLIFSTLSVWLAESDVSRAQIGFFSWVGLMFSIKVFWAPVVDRLPLPFLTSLLGKRRSWMLLAQIGIVLGLIGIAATNPGENLTQVALLALLIAFSAATQDITIDAYRIESADEEFQGAMAATYQLGYRIALIVAGAGALYTAEFISWPAAYLTMAACMGIGMITVLLIAEPDHSVSEETRKREEDLDNILFGNSLQGPVAKLAAWFSSAVISPIVDFFSRIGFTTAVLILLFIGLYRLSDITMGIMANPFYIDLGYSKSEIASIIKIYGVIMTAVGALAGGVLVVRYGIMRPLLLGAVLVCLTNLVFAYLAYVVPGLESNSDRLIHLAMTICADNFSGGLASAAFIAYMSSLTNTAYTATQYALFSSLFTLPGKFVGGFSGVVVEGFGYVSFFSYAAVLGIPAIILTIVLMRRAAADEKTQSTATSAPPVAT